MHTWDSIDQSNESVFFLDYLTGLNCLGVFTNYKQRAYEKLALQPGQYVLDVGCGLGHDVNVLADCIGTNGKVVGVDNSDLMIKQAKQLYSAHHCEFYQGNAHQLPFADASFDVCRTDRVLQHLTHPQAALQEMSRVLKPKGKIVVIEPDWDSWVINSPDTGLSRKVREYICDVEITNGHCGRQLTSHLMACKLDNVNSEAITVVMNHFADVKQMFQLEKCLSDMQYRGLLSTNETTNWLNDLQQYSHEGHFFSAISSFIVSGVKS